jgi:hypothetical protein
MEPITVAQLALLLVVGFLLFRTQSGPPSHRRWRGFRRDASIFPVMADERARRRGPESLRLRSGNAPAWLFAAGVLLAGALSWWLTH